MKRVVTLDGLVDRFKRGEKGALARLITLIENKPEAMLDVIRKIGDVKSNAHIIGITGSPGVGKSTLTNAMASQLLKDGLKVGILSVDPTSPFTGGALLGDRIRMTEISMDPNVYIRSIGARGHVGGVSRAVFDISHLYEAFGMDVIIIETVGAGQSEVDIYDLVHTTLVVLVPGYGDTIQSQKAGIIEISDIYVVNKMDLGGGEVAAQMEAMLDHTFFEPGEWKPHVLMTQAMHKKGIDALIEKIWDHRRHIEQNNVLHLRKKNRIVYKINQLLQSKVRQLVDDSILRDKDISTLADGLLDDTFKIYDTILSRLKNARIVYD